MHLEITEPEGTAFLPNAMGRRSPSDKSVVRRVLPLTEMVSLPVLVLALPTPKGPHTRSEGIPLRNTVGHVKSRVQCVEKGVGRKARYLDASKSTSAYLRPSPYAGVGVCLFATRSAVTAGWATYSSGYSTSPNCVYALPFGFPLQARHILCEDGKTI